jgi:quinol monooxygenase YgiN
VIAAVTLVSEQREAWLAAFSQVHPDVLVKDGCEAYGATVE